MEPFWAPLHILYLFRGLVFQWSHHYLELVPSQTSQKERPSHGGELLVGGWCKCAVGGMSGRGTPLAGNGPAWAFVSPGVWHCEQSRDTNAETMSGSVGLSGTLWDSSWGAQTQRQWGCKQNLGFSSPYLKLSLIGKDANTHQIRGSLNEAANAYYGKQLWFWLLGLFAFQSKKPPVHVTSGFHIQVFLKPIPPHCYKCLGFREFFCPKCSCWWWIGQQKRLLVVF